ncbi:electron transfer flavoprotein subunit beta/FixA family protein [Desulfonema ishimotonii]|uniref:Electron transfer flavoprotein subunit beta/FixA family protein n=1 Tax=Desulfonema ishimotonii TaxID=45657 RepID=A0A401FZ96_9BACT|nr:electron transfer flavoprotein subunit beta/FixA family protein [Desulfonema ishimotonii]GBC62299.1 electron transfer flavoprotein subunit beta/FixA family protein [Desulfonema ishimotonii]
MLKLIVCIKQVPMVSELPWDSRTGTLKREMADGMINPACKHALEAALQLRHRYGAHITALTMGPPMAQECLHEAIAMGADRGILMTDRRMAGADTLITSFTLARAIEKACPDFDLVLCGCHTSDSETAQVGPQLAEELDVAGVTYAEHMEVHGRTLRMERESDDFLETLEMDLPGLVTVTTRKYTPRYAPLTGLYDAFDAPDILTLDADALGLDPKVIGMKASPTRILNVRSATAEKENIVLKGAVKRMINTLFHEFGDKISGAMGKDLKTHDHDDEEE